MRTSEDTLNKDKALIGPMFDSIAWRYDFLNHFLSLGIDRSWRKKAVAKIEGRFTHPRILDVATGTGDMAVEAAGLDPESITGIDISEKMLDLARRKVSEKGLSDVISFLDCDSENICFGDDSFDAAMVAFGVRNFSDPVRGLSEMNRVIKKGGLVVVLEFSRPKKAPFRQIYNIYFRNVLPFAGRVLSKNRKAYRYLNDSVMKFADSEAFIEIMKKAGFSGIEETRLSYGIATIYTGFKK